MKCLHCKDGRTKEGTTTIMIGQPDRKVALSVDDVPAAVCSNCGATYPDAETVGKILAVVTQTSPDWVVL